MHVGENRGQLRFLHARTSSTLIGRCPFANLCAATGIHIGTRPSALFTAVGSSSGMAWVNRPGSMAKLSLAIDENSAADQCKHFIAGDGAAAPMTCKNLGWGNRPDSILGSLLDLHGESRDPGFEVGNHIEKALVEAAASGNRFFDGDIGDIDTAQHGDAAPFPLMHHIDGV